MSQDVQYITDESGTRVGVLLDLATYDQLAARTEDSQLLTNLSQRELVALSESKLSPAAQTELSELIARNRLGALSEEEEKVLDQILERVDDLNALKAKAIYTLHHLAKSVS